jgi:hypothetical protein
MDGMARRVPTRGALDPLEVNLAVLEQGDVTVVLAIMDQLFITGEDLAAFRAVVAKQIPDAKLMVFATHSHSASPVVSAPGTPEGIRNAEELRTRLFVAFEIALAEACATKVSVEVAAGRIPGPLGFARNRRVKLSNGSSVSAFAASPILPPGMRCVGLAAKDPTEIDVLAFREPGASVPKAVITSFASHIHFYEVPVFTAEAAGAARRALREELPGATTIYGLSFAGDIALQFAHPRPSDDDSDSIQWQASSGGRFGKAYAKAVVSGLQTLHFAATDVLAFCSREKEGSRNEEFLLVETLRIGSHALCSLPGEMFIEWEDSLRQDLPCESLITLCYNRSWLGYIASGLSFEEGSYEVMRGPSDILDYPSPTARAKSSTMTGHEVVDIARLQLEEMFPVARDGLPGPLP